MLAALTEVLAGPTAPHVSLSITRRYGLRMGRMASAVDKRSIGELRKHTNIKHADIMLAKLRLKTVQRGLLLQDEERNNCSGDV